MAYNLYSIYSSFLYIVFRFKEISNATCNVRMRIKLRPFFWAVSGENRRRKNGGRK